MTLAELGATAASQIGGFCFPFERSVPAPWKREEAVVIASAIAVTFALASVDEASLSLRTKTLISTFKKGGRAPNQSERDALLGLEGISAQAEITATSLSECLAALTRNADASAAEKLSKVRISMAPLFNVSLDEDSTLGEIRSAISSYVHERKALLDLAERSAKAVAQERIWIQNRSGSPLAGSVTLKLIQGGPRANGIQISAHGLPMTPGVPIRFKGQNSASFIAVPWDPRSVRLSEFEATGSIDILPSTGTDAGRVLEYATHDKKLASRWEMTGESYKWTASISPPRSSQFAQGNLEREGSYRVFGQYGTITPLAGQSILTLTISGKVDWKISSTRNGRTVTQDESYPVKQTLQVEAYSL